MSLFLNYSQISVAPSLKIVTWADGTDEEIVAMVAAADEGKINLQDYWKVGDERKVNLSAMAATGVGETHAAETVTMVLMNAGGKTLATPTPSGQTTCNFIVGLKNCLSVGGYMNSTDDNTGGWEACARRTWCNNVFRNAIPESLRGIFKQHKNITANGNSTSATTSIDYFALPAEKEVFGSNTNADSTAEASLTQFEYYKTSSNRIKKAGDNGSAILWWERSPRSSWQTLYFCLVNTTGAVDAGNATHKHSHAPFGCI